MPGLHLRNFQIGQLIQRRLPKLFNHLKKINMSTDYFTSKWIMTIFSCYLPFELITPVFDNFFQVQ